MPYQITYETEDGTVEDYIAETCKARAEKIARDCAKGSALNAAFNVTRWFVEKDGQTVSAHQVAVEGA